MRPEKPTLGALIEEAKGERGPDVDWEKVEAKLFPRVEREARAQAALDAYGGASAGAKRGWAIAAAAIAMAAAVALFLSPHHADTSLDGGGAGVGTAGPVAAGTMQEKDAAAVVHATRARDGATSRDLTSGGAIAEGDVLDAHAGRAVFKRGEPSAVSWALEDGSQVEVRGARGTLVLALAKGAVEAQVAPVLSGEAFAIDVEGTRVAVHGTHLRVERQGTRAVVDLREGVVSIGTPPRSGSTYGDLVTAPAHVEFDAADPHATLKVSHETSRVRAAQLFEPAHPPPAPPRPVVVSPPVLVPPVAPAAPITPGQGNQPPHAPAVQAPASPPPAPPPAPQAPAAVTSPVPPPPAPARVDPNPEGTIAEQVRACARKHVEHGDGVVITVSTRLDLRIGDTGMVTAAVFDPPLRLEVQACAASAIYGTRFSQPGAASIAIDVTP
jgi:hypothetical protein